MLGLLGLLSNLIFITNAYDVSTLDKLGPSVVKL